MNDYILYAMYVYYTLVTDYHKPKQNSWYDKETNRKNL